jgi:FKBP-type peptidyl-prolyl cis-trans isomerase
MPAPALLLLGLLVPALAAYSDVATEMSWTKSVNVQSLEMAASSTGLRYHDVATSEVTFSRGDTAHVLYKLYLLTEGGTALTHVYSQGSLAEVFKLRLGAGSVIPGFEEAVLSMGVGAKRVAILPPAIAYGARGMPSFGIPS